MEAPRAPWSLLQDRIHVWQSLAGLALVLLGSSTLLLLTSLPKTPLLWGTFLAAVVAPAVLLPWHERHKAQGQAQHPPSSTGLPESSMDTTPVQAVWVLWSNAIVLDATAMSSVNQNENGRESQSLAAIDREVATISSGTSSLGEVLVSARNVYA